MYSNLLGCDGERVYYDGCPIITENENILVQGSQFSLNIVETITATVEINNIRSYQRSKMSRAAQAAEFIQRNIIDVDFIIGKIDDWDMLAKLSHPISVKYYKSEEEIQLGPACWLWDYLRRSGSNGFFLPLSGGLDSCSVCLIVYSMCDLVFKAISSKNVSVIKDIRRICADEEFKPRDPQEICLYVF